MDGASGNAAAGGTVNGGRCEPEALLLPTHETRDYQLELLEMAKSRNVIICLPTGSGKTWVSLLLTKHYYKECIEKGKKIIFIANTVALVDQQYNYFNQHLPGGRVVHFVGYMNVDAWNTEEWQRNIVQADVLVMSCQIFLDILNKEIRFNQVALLIIDECHHAGKNHPMKKIMNLFHDCARDPTYPLPRVLGLTACVAKNAKNSEFGFESQMKEMEQTLNARAVTSTMYGQVLKYSTNAKIRNVVYPGLMLDQYSEAIGRLVPQLKLFIVRSEEHVVMRQLMNEHNFNMERVYTKRIDFIKELVENIADIQRLYGTLGPWCANTAIRLLMTESSKLMGTLLDDKIKIVLLEVYQTWLIEMGVILVNAMSNGAESYSPKVKLLFSELYKKRNTEDLSGLVFVERRLDCQVLNALANVFVLREPRVWSFLKCHYIIGVNGGMTLNEQTASHSLQRQTLQGFREKKYNVLFSTSVLEEGLDVPHCNFIIRFDKILLFRSFIQSMGRARSKDSEFIIFMDVEEVQPEMSRMIGFMNFAKTAVSGLIKNADCLEKEVARDITPEEIPPFCPGGKPDSPRITSYDAIPIVMMYCNTLTAYSGDAHSYKWNAPVSWYNEIEEPPILGREPIRSYQGFLVLPKRAVVRGKVTGRIMSTKKGAKRAVFLETCRLLYEAKALNQLLRPIKASLATEVLYQLDRPPHSDSAIPKRWYKTTVPNKLDKPAGPDQLYIVYQIQISLASPTGQVKEQLFNYLNRKYSTGILSTESLDMIPPFKLESGLGTLNIELINMSKFIPPECLSPTRRQILKTFQRSLFCDLIGLKNNLKLLEQISDSALWIIPIRKDSDVKYHIDYGIMAELDRQFVNGDLNPQFNKPVPEDQRSLPEDNERFLLRGGYEDAVVVPWCYEDKEHTTRSRLFCVLKVTEQTEESAIDSFGIKSKAKESKSYKMHFETKYNVRLTRVGQQLIECTEIGKTLDFLKVHKRTGKEKPKNSYIPELVRVFSLPASLYTQSRMLPAILHRTKRFLVAMQLGRSISSYPDGELYRPPYKVYDKWAYNEIVGEPNYCPESNGIPNGVSSSASSPPRFIYPKSGNGETEYKVQELVNRSARKRRRLDPLESIGTGSLPSVSNRMQCSLFAALKLSTSGPESEVMDTDIYPPIYELLEAVTLSGALDRQSLERMEVIGDSFLKYSVTLAIFGIFSACDEGMLTQIRSKVVSNENLRWLGDEKGLGGMLAGGMFSPEFNFLPPSFVPNDKLARTAMKTGVALDVFQNVEKEALSKMGHDELMKCATETKANASTKVKGAKHVDPPKAALLGYTKLREKDLADCVEAIIGAYYLAGGERRALHVMNWFGIKCPDPEGNLVVIGTQRPLTSTPSPLKENSNPRAFLPFLSELEKAFNHKFSDPWLLVEAMTHPSDKQNEVTDSFERLEFLGDAVLDFLITRHIYNKFLAKTPGQITDLRSALVNNGTFACLAVRNGFHKHLINSASSVQKSIDQFVKLQEGVNHAVTAHFISVTDNVAQDVEIPKVLGDIFESLCGALFIDLKYDLEAVWTAIYPLMKKEIEDFSADCPKAPIREIMELGYKMEIKKMQGMVECTIKTPYGNFVGNGANKKSAKDAAAKITLLALPSGRKTLASAQLAVASAQ